MERPYSQSQDGFGGAGTGSEPAQKPRTTVPGLAGTQSESQLTQREVEALRTIKRNVDRSKTAGWLLGGTISTIILTRRSPRPSNLRIAGISFLGGLAGSFLLMPVGVMMSTDVVKGVEDPQHLKNVLAGAMEERRKGGTPRVSVAPPAGANGEQGWNDPAQSPPQQQKRQQPSSFADTNDNGTFASSTGGNGFGSSSSADPFYRQGADSSPSSTIATSAPRAFPDTTDETNPDGTNASRWAQLRGERGVEPSKWEKIRQENARTAYNRRSEQSAQPQPQQEQQQPRAAGSGFSQSSGMSTLPGANTDSDPRWSSSPPQDFSMRRPAKSDDFNAWGTAEFVEEPTSSNRTGVGAQGRYTINSVNEEGERESLQGFELDSNAPIKVVKGSLLAALAGAISGSVYGVVKGQTGAGTLLASRTALNMFAFGFPFFAVREYAISPGLAMIARENSYEHPTSLHTHLRRRQNPHTRDLAASGLSGAIVGGGIAAFARGRGSIPSGIVMFGLACTGLQLAGNELRVARGKLLTRESARPVAVAGSAGGNPEVPVAAAQHAQQVSDPIREGAEQVPGNTQDVPSQVAGEIQEAERIPDSKTKGRGWLSSLKNLSPVRSLSDEEYEKKLEGRLGSVDGKLAVIREELQEIEIEERKESGGSDSAGVA